MRTCDLRARLGRRHRIDWLGVWGGYRRLFLIPLSIGVELLKYVVENPGEAAEAVRQAAVDGLKAVAKGVSNAAKAATDALTSFVDHGVAEAKEAVEELLVAGGDAAKRIAETWAKELSEGAKEIMGGLQDLGEAWRRWVTWPKPASKGPSTCSTSSRETACPSSHSFDLESRQSGKQVRLLAAFSLQPGQLMGSKIFMSMSCLSLNFIGDSTNTGI